MHLHFEFTQLTFIVNTCQIMIYVKLIVEPHQIQSLNKAKLYLRNVFSFVRVFYLSSSHDIHVIIYTYVIQH